MTTTKATKCTDCNGKGTCSTWDYDDNDNYVETTSDCDDCGGRGWHAPIAADELAQQEAASKANAAQRYRDHFDKGWHEKLCSKTACFGDRWLRKM